MGMLDKDGEVLTCTVADCSYNEVEECHAPQIKVGGDHAMCDTYTHGMVDLSRDEGMVGMCEVTQCNFNESRECHAAGITVSNHTQHADCVTFRP